MQFTTKRLEEEEEAEEVTVDIDDFIRKDPNSKENLWAQRY
jgi:hypothetical protein